MKRIVFIASLITIISSSLAFIPHPVSVARAIMPEDKKVMEIAVFKVKKEHLNEFKSLNKSMSDQLATYEGYMNSKTYKGINSDSIFIDIVWWQSLEKAKEAETRFLKDEKLKDYRESLGKVLFYDHITAIDNGTLSFNNYSEDASTIELGIFKIKEGMNSQYLETRQPLMNVISKKYGDGLKEGIAYQSIAHPLLHVEFTYWSNMEVCTKAQHEINEQEPTFTPFMQNFDNKGPSFFGFFKIIR